MSLFSRLFKSEVPKGIAQIDTLGSELAGELDKVFAQSLLDKGASMIDSVLADAKSEMERLKAEIADREAQIGDRLEKVRHASVVIDAFGAAQKLIEAGYDKPAAAMAAGPAAPAPVAAAETAL